MHFQNAVSASKQRRNDRPVSGQAVAAFSQEPKLGTPKFEKRIINFSLIINFGFLYFRTSVWETEELRERGREREQDNVNTESIFGLLDQSVIRKRATEFRAAILVGFMSKKRLAFHV